MPRPAHPPVGLALARTAKAVSRAFDASLVAAGGSRPVWLVLVALKSGGTRTQRELAAAVDIRDATLSHHLAGMEEAGLVSRHRDPENRRVHRVELTAEGDAMFHRLRVAATAHDARLRDGVSEADAAAFARVLERLQANVAEPGPAA